MARQPARPTLMAHLSREALEPIVEKKLLGGGYNVGLLPLLVKVGPWIFQKAAVLGRARCDDRLDVLGQMLSRPGEKADIRAFVSEAASSMSARYGEYPESFLDFWLTTCVPAGFDYRDRDVARRLSGSKIRLGEALPWVNIWGLKGLAFGVTYPELTAELWRAVYETADPHWEMMRQAGLDIPDVQPHLPLQEMEHLVLLQVADYAFQYFPELVEPLDLRLS